MPLCFTGDSLYLGQFYSYPPHQQAIQFDSRPHYTTSIHLAPVLNHRPTTTDYLAGFSAARSIFSPAYLSHYCH